jgi:hypothetical protein
MKHTFTEHRGGTLVGDSVEYAAAGGILVQKLFLARDLRRIFAYRHERLRKRFGASNPQDPTAVKQSYPLSEGQKTSFGELQ